MNKWFSTTLASFYENQLRSVLFEQYDAQHAHEAVLQMLMMLDNNEAAQLAFQAVNRSLFPDATTTVGRVVLPSPLILAAGFVKGQGFSTEIEALAALDAGENIVPGWRTMPNLAGPVEFGSYTCYPRLGNPGRLMWRDAATHSTQNRVGLKNPGALAAAEFLGLRVGHIRRPFGVNIAVSPGVTDRHQEQQELVASFAAFVERGVSPDWFTLNLSCPNTEDDPVGNQSHAKALTLCGAVRDVIDPIPLWVKIGPDLGEAQYRQLLRAFADSGVAAVIATNTLGQPDPDDGANMAGVGGGALRAHALRVIRVLSEERQQRGYEIALIGCGGIMDGPSFRLYEDQRIDAAQYWSALVYRGPLAAAHILHEAQELNT